MSEVIGDSHRWGFVPNNFGETCSHCYFGVLYSIESIMLLGRDVEGVAMT